MTRRFLTRVAFLALLLVLGLLLGGRLPGRRPATAHAMLHLEDARLATTVQNG